ncbi:uncharacterized protein LOC119782851 [Tachysurus ichikawai]
MMWGKLNQRYRDHFITRAPPGSIGSSTRSGWINEDTFAEFLEHLVQHTVPSAPLTIPYCYSLITTRPIFH